MEPEFAQLAEEHLRRIERIMRVVDGPEWPHGVEGAVTKATDGWPTWRFGDVAYEASRKPFNPEYPDDDIITEFRRGATMRSLTVRGEGPATIDIIRPDLNWGR